MHKPDTSDHPAALSIRRVAELSNFAKRVTCRLASSFIERDAIFKLRYQSYLRAELISQNSFGRYIEPADHAANAYLMGLYIERRLVSSLRLQIGSAATPNFSSLELFPHALEPILGNNKTIVDMSCVATDGELARPYVWLPYLILRSWIMLQSTSTRTTSQRRCDHNINSSISGFLIVSFALNSQLPPHQLASVGLVTLNFASSAKRLYENLPFLRSTPSERQQLFEHDTTPTRSPGCSLRCRKTAGMRPK